MAPNIFQVLASLVLLTCFVNYVKAKTNSDIFSIIDENTLQRKLEFTINDTLNSLKSFPNQEGLKLLQYLSLVSAEMNEQSQIEEQKLKENSTIQLPSSIIELSPDEVKFHGISFDDFVNVKEAPETLETVIPDSSDPNTIKIIYESKINEIVLSGLAEINGTNYDFFLNITDLTLREEHERTPTPAGKIVTKSILETLTFRKFTMLIFLTEEKKFVRSPNRQILRQLADSWLVTIVNVVNSRFVQSKIMAKSQLYFVNYKNAFFQAVCSLILESFTSISQPIAPPDSPPPDLDRDRNIRSEDSDYDYYSFVIGDINNFSNISSCSSGPLSLQIGKNCCTNDNYYLHILTFACTYSSHPFFNWTLIKGKTEKQVHYRTIPSSITTEQLVSIVRYWSATLTISTDENGRKTEDDFNVSIDFGLKKTGISRADDLSYRFLQQIKNKMVTSLQDKVNKLLTPPA